MILMFNRETLEGKWFRDTELDGPEDTTGYTEKKPPYANYLWNEALGEWVLPEKVPEPTETGPG